MIGLTSRLQAACAVDTGTLARSIPRNDKAGRPRSRDPPAPIYQQVIQ